MIQLAILVQKKEKGAYDGVPFVIGIITLLKQFHSSTTSRFLAYLGQYVKSYVNTLVTGEQKAVNEIPEESISVLLFLEEFVKFTNLDRKFIEGFFPQYIFDQFQH